MNSVPNKVDQFNVVTNDTAPLRYILSSLGPNWLKNDVAANFKEDVDSLGCREARS